MGKDEFQLSVEMLVCFSHGDSIRWIFWIVLVCVTCSTPVNTHPKLFANRDPVSGPTRYRNIASALQYLIFTRLDVAYAV